MRAKNAKSEILYSKLCFEIIRVLGQINHQALLYVEGGRAWAGISLYQNTESRVIYVDETGEIDDLVIAIWDSDKASNRWREMQIDIDGIRSEVRHFPARSLDKRESYDDRRERAVRERFGDKRIYYSPLRES